MAKQVTMSGPATDDAWRDVMRQVDAAYSELIAHQTELERKNTDLEHMRAFMESVLGAMSDALIVCDRVGRIEQTNGAFRSLTQMGEAAVAPTPAKGAIFDLVDARDREALRKAFAAASGAGVAALELELLTGTPLEVKIAPRRDRRQRLLGFVLIGRPIGELRRAYRDLEEAHERLKAGAKLFDAAGENGVSRPIGGGRGP